MHQEEDKKKQKNKKQLVNEHKLKIENKQTNIALFNGICVASRYETVVDYVY
jgi:hypothetical protein